MFLCANVLDIIFIFTGPIVRLMLMQSLILLTMTKNPITLQWNMDNKLKCFISMKSIDFFSQSITSNQMVFRDRRQLKYLSFGLHTNPGMLSVAESSLFHYYWSMFAYDRRSLVMDTSVVQSIHRDENFANL